MWVISVYVTCLCVYVCAHACVCDMSVYLCVCIFMWIQADMNRMCSLDDRFVFWSLHGTLMESGSLFVVAFVCPQVAACHWMLLALPPISPLQYRDSDIHSRAWLLPTFWRSKVKSSHLQGQCFTHWATSLATKWLFLKRNIQHLLLKS